MTRLFNPSFTQPACATNEGAAAKAYTIGMHGVLAREIDLLY